MPAALATPAPEAAAVLASVAAPTPLAEPVPAPAAVPAPTVMAVPTAAAAPTPLADATPSVVGAVVITSPEIGITEIAVDAIPPSDDTALFISRIKTPEPSSRR